MKRTILHCDMNSFYASVELIERPDLRDVPMAVCGSTDDRHGIILAKNEHAKKYGIVTAETLWQARKKCPSLMIVPPHHDKYQKYCKMINEIYLRYTDQVEPFSIDESWLDVTSSISLFGDGKKIADEIRETIKKELNLTLSAGVSYNKVFAKMGSDYKKPDATTVITEENFKELLWPLPASELFFCGAKTAAKLKEHGIFTIGDIASAEESFLFSLLGKHGSVLHSYALGLDDEPVRLFSDKSPLKSAGHGITFSRDLTDADDIKAACIHLSDAVAVRLRNHSLITTCVKVDIKDSSLKTVSRQAQINKATNLAIDIYHTALEIISATWPAEKPIRMLTVTAVNLKPENENELQLSIFDYKEKLDSKDKDLEDAMDSIRHKYGKSSITFGKPKKL